MRGNGKTRVAGAGASRICWFAAVLVLGVLVGVGRADEPAGQSKDTAAANRVGDKACQSCHQDLSKSFEANPHTRIGQHHGLSGVSCEACHGAGKGHIDGKGEKAKIFNPSTADAVRIDQECMSCHKGGHAEFEQKTHGQAQVSCLSCHSIHKSQGKHLLSNAEPGLCYGCHQETRAQFDQPFHHRVNEGKMLCSECHMAAAGDVRKSLNSSAVKDEACARCHVAVAGPFRHEHAAVRTEGCSACHFAHGGPNAKLMKKADVNALCLLCHAATVNFNAAAGSAHNAEAQKKPCTSCHQEIHGSNQSPLFLAGKP